MVDPNRRIASAVFVGSMIMTFVSIYALHSKFFTLLFIIVQFCSYIWYILSYIPFGRDICAACVKRLWGGGSSETLL